MTLSIHYLNKQKYHYIYLIYFLFILICSSIFLLCAQDGYCAQVTLSWNPKTESELAGYNLYIGTSSRFYSQVIDVGNNIEYTVDNLSEGISYYFTVTAYDIEGHESVYSNEVSTTFIKVISPNGAEVIPSGSIYSTYWLAPPEVVNFKFKYSLDNGLTWIQKKDIISGTSYSWSVPKPFWNKRRCFINIEGYDEYGTKIGEDISDEPFIIEVVKLKFPNRGNILTSGKQYTIRWTTNATKYAVVKVKLYYTNNGATWHPIKTISGSNPGSYKWKVPTVPIQKTKCKVKVQLFDAFGKSVGRDISDRYFTIQPSP